MKSFAERLLQKGIERIGSEDRTVHDDFRSFLLSLERHGDLKRVPAPVSPQLEITEICHRTLQADGPALRFEHPTEGQMPLAGNVFGSERRVLAAIGLDNREQLRALGDQLAWLSLPQLPTDASSMRERLPTVRKLAAVNPITIDAPPCQDVVLEGDDVDLGMLPIQHCWPDDAGKLITFGLVVTRGPLKSRSNIGIYRQQVIGRNRLIMRWLHHRGGALDFAEHQREHPGERFPVAVAIGADPATTLAAVAPIPDTISEFQFAGLLRGAKSKIAKCLGHDLVVPATAEIILEGFIEPGDMHDEGPFGDHTGYYNAVESFPVFTVERITHRRNPIYQGTYMGKPPHDEPSVLAATLNELFVPLIRAQFPEIVDFYLPPEACSYRLAIVSIRKGYKGHARRIMMGVWSCLRQFTYTKFVIVTDEDVDIRSMNQVWWAMTTRMDPARDTLVIDRTPVDYLDFASPVSGIGSKIGFDATSKWPGETDRAWGRPIRMNDETRQRIDSLWNELGID